MRMSYLWRLHIGLRWSKCHEASVTAYSRNLLRHNSITPSRFLQNQTCCAERKRKGPPPPLFQPNQRHLAAQIVWCLPKTVKKRTDISIYIFKQCLGFCDSIQPRHQSLPVHKLVTGMSPPPFINNAEIPTHCSFQTVRLRFLSISNYPIHMKANIYPTKRPAVVLSMAQKKFLESC